MNIIKEIENINKKINFLVSLFSNNSGGNTMIDLSQLEKEVENAINLAKLAGDKILSNIETKASEDAATIAKIANLHITLSSAMANLNFIISNNVIHGEGVLLNVVDFTKQIPHDIEVGVENLVDEVKKII